MRKTRERFLKSTPQKRHAKQGFLSSLNKILRLSFYGIKKHFVLAFHWWCDDDDDYDGGDDDDDDDDDNDNNINNNRCDKSSLPCDKSFVSAKNTKEK